MRTQNTLPSRGVLAARASCMALQTTGFAMFIPLFALRFDSFGAGVQALSTGDMAYSISPLPSISRACWGSETRPAHWAACLAPGW